MQQNLMMCALLLWRRAGDEAEFRDCEQSSRSLKELLLNNFQTLSWFVLFFLACLLKVKLSMARQKNKKIPPKRRDLKLLG